MPSSCKDIRAALAQCLAESECVLSGNKPSDCIRLPLSDTLPIRCQQLKKGYGDCKRGMIDMRKRFRGNKPVQMGTEPEDNSQLYASLGEKKKPPVIEAPEGESESGR